MQKQIFASLFICVTAILGATSAYALTCSSGYHITGDYTTCAQLCSAGITSLRSNTGTNVPLFATRRSNPSLNIQHNGITCYAELAIGQNTTSTDAIHIEFETQKYHTYAPVSSPNPYLVQVGAWGTESTATNAAIAASKYGETIIVKDGSLHRVRIVNLNATQTKTIYNSLVSDGYAPGVLKNGTWTNINNVT